MMSRPKLLPLRRRRHAAGRTVASAWRAVLTGMRPWPVAGGAGATPPAILAPEAAPQPPEAANPVDTRVDTWARRQACLAAGGTAGGSAQRQVPEQRRALQHPGPGNDGKRSAGRTGRAGYRAGPASPGPGSPPPGATVPRHPAHRSTAPAAPPAVGRMASPARRPAPLARSSRCTAGLRKSSPEKKVQSAFQPPFCPGPAPRGWPAAPPPSTSHSAGSRRRAQAAEQVGRHLGQRLHVG